MDDRLEHVLPTMGSQLRVDGHLVTVIAATATAVGADLVVQLGDGSFRSVALTIEDLASVRVPSNDGGGDPKRSLAAIWSRWMQHAIPRIRSAVMATRPLRPYAHQDEAVFSHMLAQPRLRYLLADEPGTGKTIMTGMYILEATRRGLIPGRTIVVVPAHLVEKWKRDLLRYFAVDAANITPEIARDPRDLDPRVMVWVVSVDLYTHNVDVRRKVSGNRASWSLAVFDEAHRLTPTSQYLGAAQDLADRSHHLLLLTATPHRGKEHYFRGLLNLLDPTLYPWDPRETEYSAALRPSALSFLRRMKEDLRDLEGKPLFPPRYATTVSVELTNAEQDAYDAVMDYVDNYYDAHSTLARSIYGKRAASSLTAASETLGRRRQALQGPASGRSATSTPEEFLDERELDLAVEDDDAWVRAEQAVVNAATENKTEEIAAVDSVLAQIRAAQSVGPSTKWLAALELLDRHGITPSSGQLLVFTEFADTARWLARQFSEGGFSVETLEGSVGHRERDVLQQRFLDGEFQVLVSTDAGGEGIDLQSASTMIDWDIPWSLVRLEQRMGRLHRIGQKNPVHIYHLVAPHTREGRVQQVMLANLDAAGAALGGRIFDLLDATAARVGFDYARALTEAQRHAHAVVDVPATAELITRARELVRDEDRLRSPTNTEEALDRFRSDRIEAINPVIVDAFLQHLAAARRWELSPGPAAGIRIVASGAQLPAGLGPGRRALVAVDGASVRTAVHDGAAGLDEVIVLGPTEATFLELVQLGLSDGEMDLVRGSVLEDASSLTGYTVLVYDAEIEVHDGVRRIRRKTPLLIRYSGAGAFEVAWESVMTLRVGPAGAPSMPLTPAVRAEGMAAATAALLRESDSASAERAAWVARARKQLDEVEYRYLDELDNLDVASRRARRDDFSSLKVERIAQLEDIARVVPSAPRMVGWVEVRAGARTDQLGYDPDSERVAVATVLTELDRLGFDVDDRQTAGVGYDLLARHRTTREQRLIEVKGFHSAIGPVWLEQHEWAQAQQRGADYWLYVVVQCEDAPRVALRAQDPAGQLADGSRRIERFQIPLRDLRRWMETS